MNRIRLAINLVEVKIVKNKIRHFLIKSDFVTKDNCISNAIGDQCRFQVLNKIYMKVRRNVSCIQLDYINIENLNTRVFNTVYNKIKIDISENKQIRL